MEKQRAPPTQRRVTVFWRSKEKYVTVAAAEIITAAAKKGDRKRVYDSRRTPPEGDRRVLQSV